MKKNIYFFIGTTAELIRIAPIINLLRKRRVRYKLVTSGQTKVQFDDLKDYTGDLRADIAFEEKVNKSSIVHFGLWTLKTFFSALSLLSKEFKLVDKKRSAFVVCGDPVSTTIGAIVAKIYGLKVVHLESGDMSGDLLEPFPEEICRNINIRVADVLFPPGKWAKSNLRNINKTKIDTVYNTQVETFFWFLKRTVKIDPIFRRKRYFILILHRQEHVLFGKDWSERTLKSVIDEADPSLTCLLFKFPLSAKIIKSIHLESRIRSRKLVLMSPVSYPEFLSLLKNSEFIATDGATNQMEAYLIGKPCIILRNRTEQAEGLGENVILYENNFRRLKSFLLNYNKYVRKPIKPTVMPSEVVVNYLASL